MFRGLAVLFFAVFSKTLVAGEIVLSGAYQGKDLYVQNPFNSKTSTFCTNAVYVNDRLVLDKPQASAFRIDLSFLPNNALVVIRILFQDNCEPGIVNPQVLKAPQSFQFLTAQADNNSITWTAKGDKNGIYYLEHKWEKEDWTVVDTVEVISTFEQNKYAVEPSHIKGDNSYRVKYINSNNEEFYSVEFMFTAADNYITFYPKIATSQLKLSDSCHFEVMDFFGKVVKKGEGRDVILVDLKPGKYYLNIQNRKEVFIKR
ncbi:hypothetical protein [Fulvivirga lutimaris]|uniref:hypothetical protein n=1 Tax=Fulvivirga lutimaris TaxID=1819566 RepID=UPI0012BD273D|nr:hypothetical protein [Fulvivirga lutimaris]